MNLDTKFDINEKVFMVTYENYQKPCEICDETGSVKIKDNTFWCPKCSGKGYNNNGVHWFVFEQQVKIDSIFVVVRENKIQVEIFYKYLNSYSNFDHGKGYSNDFFKTEEDAKKECEIRNKVKIDKGDDLDG